MGEIIMITSGKGGVGKTTTTALMGVQLSRLDKKVVLMDMDFGLRNLDLQFFSEQKIRYNIVDVLQGICVPKQSCLQITDGLYMIPGTKDYNFSVSDYELSNLFSQLKKQFDYILVDTPAGINDIHRKLIPFVDKAILVMTWDKSSLSDAMAMSRLLQTGGIKNYLVINELGKNHTTKSMNKEVQFLCEQYLRCEYLGRLPFQKHLVMINLSKRIRSLEEICSKI